LARVIKSCRLDSTRYKGHRFRIGAASHAAALAILILKFANSGDGTQMLLKVIFAFLAFHTVQHHIKCYFPGSNLVAGWKGMGLSGRAVCKGNCSALGFGDILFFSSHYHVVFLTCVNLSQ